MLLQFSCENHRSIKERITFSTIASKDTKYEEYLGHFSNFKVLPTEVIYGPNGSGKSNFIHAIEFVQALVTNSINYQPGFSIYQAVHKLSPLDAPSSYDIQFVTNDIRYAYGFSIKNHLVEEEYLYYFPNGRQVKIFERNKMEIIPGDRYKKAFDISFSILKENRLFLSCAANYTNLVEIENAFLFFRNELVIYNPHINQWMEYSIELMQNNDEIKEKFLEILNFFGTGAKDIKIKLEKKRIDGAELPKEIPDFIKNIIASQEANVIEAKVVYDQFETDLMTEESTGVKKLFEMICPIIDILLSGKVLICDEMETGLHESIVYEIVRLFKVFQSDKFAQLIFTTHDTNLLDTNLFRRDQIWFTQLNEERSTDLFSLSEIKNVRKDENLAKGYMSGKYGAIPMLNNTILNLFNNNEQ